MKVFLAKHERLDMTLGYMIPNGKCLIRRVDIPVQITPSGNSIQENEFCEKVKNSIAVKSGENGRHESTDNIKSTLIISMASSENGLTGYLGILDGYGGILELLHNIFGDANVRLQVTITNFRDLSHASPVEQFNIFTKELNLCCRSNLQAYASEDVTFQFSDGVLLDKFKMDVCPLGGSITVTAIVKNSFLHCTSCQHTFQIYKTMLEEEICCDAVILAKDGIPVKCHKGILSAQSPVFRTMFQSDMQEGNTGVLEVRDMSEESVRALLAYLYYWKETCVNSQVAFDLFQAAHKYDVPSLETLTKKLLLAKPIQWFDVEVALKLFVFVSKLTVPEDEVHELKMKAARVIKFNYQTVKITQPYKKIFMDDPKTAEELCTYAIHLIEL